MDNRNSSSKLARILFFQNQVHQEVWKSSMAGENEERVLNVVRGIGYVEGIDFKRQHPIGERFVIDIAFVKEQVAIEVDGDAHNCKKQKRMDDKRDRYLRQNNWIPIRIKDKEFFGYKGSFYKNLIREIVEERRRQWEIGGLFPIDIPNYKDEDYE